MMCAYALRIWYNVRQMIRLSQKSTKRILGETSPSDATATLANEGEYTLFSFRDRRIKFRAPRCLRRYVKVKTWNDGYLEVEADYGRRIGVVEEYIDLRPVLRCLMISPKRFLSPIKNVEVAHA
jgi:hypothetical protein